MRVCGYITEHSSEICYNRLMQITEGTCVYLPNQYIQHLLDEGDLSDRRYCRTLLLILILK